jgi:hypothetical protein
MGMTISKYGLGRDNYPDNDFPSDAIVQRILLILTLGHAMSLFDAGFT